MQNVKVTQLNFVKARTSNHRALDKKEGAKLLVLKDFRLFYGAEYEEDNNQIRECDHPCCAFLYWSDDPLSEFRKNVLLMETILGDRKLKFLIDNQYKWDELQPYELPSAKEILQWGFNYVAIEQEEPKIFSLEVVERFEQWQYAFKKMLDCIAYWTYKNSFMDSPFKSLDHLLVWCKEDYKRTEINIIEGQV